MSGSLLLQGYPFDEEVPDGWAMAPLGMISESIRPGFASGEHNNEAEGIPHLRPMNISSQGEIDLSDVRYVASDKSSLRIEEGEVLFNNTNSPAWVGKSAVIRGSGEYAFSNHMTRLKVNDHFIDSDFIARQLHYLSTSGYFQIHCKKHVNQASISSGVLEQSVPILIPPLAEQKRIVARIEQLQAHSRRARAALESIPDLLEQLRQSILAAAFRGDLTKKWREQHPDVEPASELLKRIRTERRKRWEASELEKLKAGGLTGNQLDAEFTKRRKQYQEPEPVDTTDLPGLPEGWCWTKIYDVGDVQLGRQRAPRYHTGKHMRPYLRVQNVFEDRLDFSDIMEMDFPPEDYERYHLRSGDILLNEGQSLELVGRPAMYQGEIPEACFTNTLIRFTPDPEIESEYPLLLFIYYLHSGRFRQDATISTNIAHLGAARFAEIEFPLPPKKEQELLVRLARASLDGIRGFFDLETTIAKMLDDLDNSILSKAFRGELVPQDPNDEPASVLLERIRQEKTRQVAKQRPNGKRKGKHTNKQ